MPTPQELERLFRSTLESDMTVMLGLVGAEESHMRPMTAQFEAEGGPIWFFTATDTAIAENLARNDRAVLTLQSRSHDLFACLHGRLRLDNDPQRIDQFWSSYVEAWFEGGKRDPKLALLRLTPEHGEIWENANSFVAGIKMLFGVDPKEEFKDQVAEVDMR